MRRRFIRASPVELATPPFLSTVPARPERSTSSGGHGGRGGGGNVHKRRILRNTAFDLAHFAAGARAREAAVKRDAPRVRRVSRRR